MNIRNFLLDLRARRGAGLALPPLLALAVVAAGCGKGDGPVRAAASGHVSLDGAPLPAGVVRFIPTGATEGPAAAATVKDGAFELQPSEGPVVGTHRVEIEMLDHWGFPADDEAAFVQHFEQAPRSKRPKSPIPESYNRRSTLIADIKADQPNEFEFPLHSAGAGMSQR